MQNQRKKTMIIGYARVFTTGHNLDVQQEHLQQAGCTKIYEEKITGFDRKRPQLEKMLKNISEGDTLIICSLDRLARSTHDLFEITRKLKEKEALFLSLREPWADTTSPMGKFLLTVFGGLSELERSLINDRTAEGRKMAVKRGVQFGRKPKLNHHQQKYVQKMITNGKSMREIARHFNVGVRRQN
jgi:DNA invertase Pin-like site-specific DNA recombinase